MTSHDVINIIRKLTNEKRVGHAGTLDPFATGLLIVGVGRKTTKNLDRYLKQDKVYTGVMYLGATSTTEDPEGKISNVDCKPPGKEQIGKVFSRFTGEISQVPPQYSAIKIQGKKAYELARKGENPILKPRIVHIHSLELKNYKFPRIRFETKVSSGTYVRSLARDIGRDLGCGAYLETLNRIRVGDIDISQARDLNTIEREFKI